MLGHGDRHTLTTKSKNQKPTTKMLPGHIERRRVRCGKPNCKCARGGYHVAHYRVWYAGGQRFRRFIRAESVEEVRAACDEYRGLQVEIRRGRVEYRATLVRFRGLMQFLSEAEKAGWL